MHRGQTESDRPGARGALYTGYGRAGSWADRLPLHGPLSIIVSDYGSLERFVIFRILRCTDHRPTVRPWRTALRGSAADALEPSGRRQISRPASFDQTFATAAGMVGLVVIQSGAASSATFHAEYDFGNSFRRGRCGDRCPFSMGMQDTRPRIERRHPSSNEFVGISCDYNQIFQGSNRRNMRFRHTRLDSLCRKEVR